MNANPNRPGKEDEKPPLPEGREDLLALVREVCGAIPATVLEIGDDGQVLAFVQSLQRSNLLPEPLEEENGEQAGEGESDEAKPGTKPDDAKPAKTEPQPGKTPDAAEPKAELKPGPDANPGAGKPKTGGKSAEEDEDGGERRSQMLSYVAKSLQEAAKLLRDAPQDQVGLFAKRLRMIVNDLKANLDQPD